MENQSEKKRHYKEEKKDNEKESSGCWFFLIKFPEIM